MLETLLCMHGSRSCTSHVLLRLPAEWYRFFGLVLGSSCDFSESSGWIYLLYMQHTAAHAWCALPPQPCRDIKLRYKIDADGQRVRSYDSSFQIDREWWQNRNMAKQKLSLNPETQIDNAVSKQQKCYVVRMWGCGGKGGCTS
eukprot:1143298-Pelagomonas_calceolata.AAC.3